VALTRRDSHNSWTSFWGAFQSSLLVIVQDIHKFDERMSVTAIASLKAHTCQCAFEGILRNILVLGELRDDRQKTGAIHEIKETERLQGWSGDLPE
jgi:hypothetical protein